MSRKKVVRALHGRKPPQIKSLIGLPDDQVLTLADVAHILGIHYSTAHELVCGGAMPFLRIGTGIRVEVSSLRAYIKSRRVAARHSPNDFITVKKKAS